MSTTTEYQAVLELTASAFRDVGYNVKYKARKVKDVSVPGEYLVTLSPGRGLPNREFNLSVTVGSNPQVMITSKPFPRQVCSAPLSDPNFAKVIVRSYIESHLTSLSNPLVKALKQTSSRQYLVFLREIGTLHPQAGKKIQMMLDVLEGIRDKTSVQDIIQNI